ncbi:MAG: acyl-CoA thioesterase [Deltaproteobacteria bacterium]|nr:MAG: acyl-CoA thioesterase [Deltaproteobacteria bacterium]
MPLYKTFITVRFNEVDMYQIVWHGRFIEYFEIARNQLAQKFGLDPINLKKKGYMAPVIELSCRYFLPAKLNDNLVIETGIKPSDTAKLIFIYNLFRSNSNNELIAKGETIHVITTLDGVLLYHIPDEIDKSLKAMIDYLQR